jgi:hypothetical protein
LQVLALCVPSFEAAGLSVADGEFSQFSPHFCISLGLVLDIVLGHQPSDFGAPNIVSAIFLLGKAKKVVSGRGEHL